MKKTMFLIVTLVTILVVNVQAQWREVMYGLKGGWNISNISNVGANNKMSVHLGAFAEWRINDYLGISQELLYSRQGFRDKFHVENLGKVKQKIRLNYLNIPILAKLYILDAISIDLGPQFGFVLNGKDKQKSDDVIIKSKIKDFNVLDVSFVLGASCRLNDFIFSSRYNIGLTNVLDYGKDNNKNHVFQLSVGYCLNNLF